MGVLRMMLALAVICEHIGGTPVLQFWFSAKMAVLIFFVISGFYMSLIYATKYSKYKNGYTLFYSNRALRLYPTYFFSLTLYLILGSVTGLHSQNPSLWFFDISSWNYPQIFTPLANIFLFGCDYLAIAGKPIVILPAWSIASELLFYLMVPFIISRPFVIAALIFTSVSVRIYFIVNGYNDFPLLYFFFPSTMVYFLMGHLGFRIYDKIKNYAISKYIGIGGVVFFFAYISYKIFVYEGFFLSFFEPMMHNVQGILLFSAIAVFIPFLFVISKDSKIDRLIGNLSYSLYLLGNLAIDGMIYIFPNFTLTPHRHWAIITVALILSIGTYFAIEKPIEAIRRKRVENSP